eukprot:Rmarinus@m.13870
MESVDELSDQEYLNKVAAELEEEKRKMKEETLRRMHSTTHSESESDSVHSFEAPVELEGEYGPDEAVLVELEGGEVIDGLILDRLKDRGGWWYVVEYAENNKRVNRWFRTHQLLPRTERNLALRASMSGSSTKKKKKSLAARLRRRRKKKPQAGELGPWCANCEERRIKLGTIPAWSGTCGWMCYIRLTLWSCFYGPSRLREMQLDEVNKKGQGRAFGRQRYDRLQADPAADSADDDMRASLGSMRASI